MSDWASGRGQSDRDEASLRDELENVFEQRLRRRQTIIKVVFGVLGLIGAVVLVRSIPAPNFRATNALTVGEQAIMNNTSMVAVDDDALSDMMDLQVVDDQVGLNLLQREGRVFVLDEGTRVLVIEARFTSVLGPGPGRSKRRKNRVVAVWTTETVVPVRFARLLRVTLPHERLPGADGLRARSRITSHFGIPSSRHLRPFLNRRSSK